MPGSSARICIADGVQEADADQPPISLHREARLLLLERPLPGRMPAASDRPGPARGDGGLLPLGRHLLIEGHLLHLGIGAAPPRSLAGQQDQPVHEQERRGEQRPAKDGTKRVFEQ
jgi:hypothetical protein